MSLSVTVVAGALPADGQIITNAVLRQIALPTVTLAGTIGTALIPDGAVTTAKLADGVLAASTLGRGKMADGFVTAVKVATGAFTADAAGRLPFAAGFVNAALLDDGTRTGVCAYAAGTTTAGVIAASLGTAPAAYAAGQEVNILIDTTNAGATDLNLNALGAKNVFKNINQELAPGDLVAGDVAKFVYDGTQFQLQRRNVPVVVASARNLVAKPNSGTPNTKVDLTADELVLKDANNGAYVAATVSITTDIGATGANGIDTGAIAANTWYYQWVIYNGTTVAGLFSLSSTAPTLPAGYTFKALAGVVRSDASSHFRSFYQNDRMVWTTAVAVFTTANAGTTSYTAVSLATAVPPIAKSALGMIGNATNTLVRMAVASDATNAVGAANFGSNQTGGALDGFFSATHYDIALSTAQQLVAKMSGATNDFQITVNAFRF